MKTLLAAIILAHSWYDPWCCNEADCKPAPAGQVTEGPQGYGVRLSGRTVLVPYGDSRLKSSLDGRFHVCEYPKGEVRCLYITGGAS